MKILILFSLFCIVINIFNSIYISRCKSKLEMYFHALFPSVICTSIAAFVNIIISVFKLHSQTLSPINIIIAVLICIIFLIINAFVLVSIGVNNENDKSITIGLLFIFAIPIIILIALPLDIILYLVIKFRRTTEEVKVTEEEIFDKLVSANDYFAGN